MPIRTHRDLIAWQRGLDLVVNTYTMSEKWPKEELFGLIAQARRAAVSVVANVAEGHGRSDREFGHFLTISLGSLRELETCVFIAERLGFGSGKARDAVMKDAAEAGRLVNGLITSTRSGR